MRRARDRFEHVYFVSYNGETDKFERVCTVYLVEGRLIYKGRDAKRVQKEVEGREDLTPYLKKSGYSLLAQLPHAFCGSYFYATTVQGGHL